MPLINPAGLLWVYSRSAIEFTFIYQYTMLYTIRNIFTTSDCHEILVSFYVMKWGPVKLDKVHMILTINFPYRHNDCISYYCLTAFIYTYPSLFPQGVLRQLPCLPRDVVTSMCDVAAGLYFRKSPSTYGWDINHISAVILAFIKSFLHSPFYSVIIHALPFLNNSFMHHNGWSWSCGCWAIVLHNSSPCVNVIRFHTH